MKKTTILEGFHRPLSLLPAFLIYRPTRNDTSYTISKYVFFTDACRYHLDGGDQSDWNKLVGFFFGLFGIHKDSLRVVWCYNPETDLIDIAMYYYVKGKREYRRCTSVPVNTVCLINLIYDTFNKIASLEVKIADAYLVSVPLSFPKKPVFGCGPYFGGNRRAPQDITIYEY